jgi:hypothetical protein
LKVIEVEIVLCERFTQIDDICKAKMAPKVGWGRKILSELISRRISSQRAKNPTPSPVKRKGLEGAKESPTKKAKWLVMPAVTLVNSVLGRPCLGLAGLFQLFSVSYGAADVPLLFPFKKHLTSYLLCDFFSFWYIFLS